MNTKIPGIYCIKCAVDQKVYVGGTSLIHTRWLQHKRDLRANRHENSRLQEAYDMHGESVFEYIVLEPVEDQSMLLVREQHWIDYFNSSDLKFGYNICPTAGSHLGRKASAETRAKMSAMRQGRKLSPEQVEKIRAHHLGSKRSAEAKRKMALAKLGTKRTPEQIAALAAHNKGLKRSDEVKARMSAAHIGKPKSPEHRAKLSEAAKQRAAREKALKLGLSIIQDGLDLGDSSS